MEWIVYAVVMIIVGIVSYFAAQRAQKTTSLAPGEVSQPTVNQGERFAKLFGTRYIDAPKVAWMGDLTTDPIQK